MKFKLHTDSEEFLTCDSCEREDFDLSPGKTISSDGKYKHFLFYECPKCAGAGFWVHDSTINEKLNFGIAIARRKAVKNLKVTAV